MSTTTSRLALTQPTGADPPSALRTSIGGNATTLDNAAIYQPSTTLVLRPAANTVPAGSLHKTSDTGQLAFGDGSTWAPLNLAFSQPSSSTTLSPGQHVLPSAGTTMTLPSTPPDGTIVAIQAPLAATGASPVTVSSPVTMYGPGMGATSFTLGMPMAYVALRYIAGANDWLIVSGQQDTGWVALTFTSNWLYTSSPVTTPPSFRKIGGTLYFKGQVTNATGGTLTAGTYITTSFPASALPSFTANLAVVLNLVAGPAIGLLSIGGTYLNLNLAAGSVTASGQISLDGASCSMS